MCSYLKNVILIIFFGFLAFALNAQNTGQVNGFVKDAETQEVLIGVTVKLADSTQTIGSVTDINGYYQITDIPVGTINLVASYVGYESATNYNVVVQSGAPVNINFKLKQKSSKLEEVVVESSPFESTTETPNSIQSLSRQEIVSYPGGNNDIAKVVQSLPGVSGSVGFRNDIIIRGGAPNENVYYLDGVEIPNINHFATQGSAGGPVGMLNVSFIDGVTLSTSAFGAQYDNVLSGVLQFDQRTGNPQKHQYNFRLSASEAAITAEGPIKSPNTTYIASVRRSYLQFLFKQIGLPFLPDYWDYQYKVNHKFDNKNQISFIGLGSIDNLTINKPDEATIEQEAQLDQLPLIKQWTTTHGVTWRRLMDGSFFTLTGSANILNNNVRRYRDNENQTGLRLKNESQEAEYKLRYNYTKFLGEWTLSGGFLAQVSDYFNNSYNKFNDTLPAIEYNTKINFFRYGVFGTVQKSFLSDRLTTSLGLRMDGNTFSETGNQIYRTLSPRFSIAYNLTQQWKISASAGRYYKILPYTILGFQNSNGNFANQNEPYIESNHVSGGITYLPRKSTRITLEGFYKYYRNYPVSVRDSISLANLGGNFETLGNEDIQSAGLGRTYGLELTFQQKLQKNFYGILAYTLYWSRFTGFDQNKFIPSAWDNRHLITFTGGYKLPRNWEAGLRVRWLGPAPFTPIDSAATLQNYFTRGEVLDYSRANTERLTAFFQTDIRIDKKWNFKNWSLNVFFEIQNVLGSNLPNDPDYTLARAENDPSTIITPPRLIRVPNTDNSGRIPSLGVIIDF